MKAMQIHVKLLTGKKKGDLKKFNRDAMTVRPAVLPGSSPDDPAVADEEARSLAQEAAAAAAEAEDKKARVSPNAPPPKRRAGGTWVLGLFRASLGLRGPRGFSGLLWASLGPLWKLFRLAGASSGPLGAF